MTENRTRSDKVSRITIVILETLSDLVLFSVTGPRLKPSSYLVKCCTWSQYKHYNTAKYLVSVTPQGNISYISKGWGGRTSDKYIIENCGYLRYLSPGDLVLADRGFNVADSVAMQRATLNM